MNFSRAVKSQRDRRLIKSSEAPEPLLGTIV
jgi:hypothetical protein